MTATLDPFIGQLVGGRYEVLRRIGKGGVGTIYEVRNIRLGRSFALKAIDPMFARDPATVQRFRREADIVARIKHPNIVDVIDWDELPDGSPCLVMEYLVGEDLAHRIRATGPLPWPVIGRIADQVLAALSATHASGVVHRDLKPENIFLATDGAGDERVKLLDFGVSKIQDSSTLVTHTSMLVGTPAYMAPEQAEGRSEQIGTHTDIWAMSVILYELATGVRPFEGTNLPSLLYQVCHADPTPLGERRPDAPAAFVELVQHGLVREVDGRLGDAAIMRARMIAALAGLTDGEPSIQRPSVRAISSIGSRPGTDPASQLLETLPHTAAAAVPTAVSTRQDAAPRSSRRTPLALGIAGLAVAGIVTAVVLATRPTGSRARDVRITSADHDAGVDRAADAASPDAAVAPVDAVAPPGDAGVVTAPRDAAAPKQRLPRPRPVPAGGDYIDQVGAAVGRRMHELVTCVNDQPPDPTVTTIKATIAISAAGKATGVTFTPASIDGSALGNCLRSALVRASYPTSDRDQRVSIPLRAKPAR